MNETPDRNYKDDPKDFAQSADSVKRGTSSEYAGGGPGDSSANFTPAKGEQEWQEPGEGQEAQRSGTDPVANRSADAGPGNDGDIERDGSATENGGPKP